MGFYQIQDLFPYLKNPTKYVGTRPLTCRSGWEITFATKVLDANPSVIEWGSESLIIPYIDPNDGKQHRYFPDFWLKVKDTTGNIKEFVVEIKPLKELSAPKEPLKKTRSYVNAVRTYIKNTAKWDAAKKICEDQRQTGRNVEFLILTEKDIPER